MNRALRTLPMRRLPAVWALSSLGTIWRQGVGFYALQAIAITAQRLLRLLSILIPIKVLLVVSMRPDAPLDVFGWFEVTLTAGQVATLVAPVAALNLVGYFVGQFALRKQEERAVKQCGDGELSPRERKLVGPVIRLAANCLGGVLLLFVCVGLMGFVNWELPMAASLFVVMVAATTRHRLKRLRTVWSTTDQSISDEGDSLTLLRVAKVAESSQAALQIVFLPLILYILADAVIAGLVGPALAIAAIFFFRLFLGSMQLSVNSGARTVHILSSERNVQRHFLAGHRRKT